MKAVSFVELCQEDLCGHTRQQLACSDCIKGYCPSRTVAFCESSSFLLCGAKQISAAVLDAYRARSGSTVRIEHPPSSGAVS